MASEKLMLEELMRFPSMEKLSISQLKPLELEESFNPNGYITPRYGDGNIESDQIERELIHKSTDKITSSQIKTFIHGSDESSSPDNQPYPLCRLKFLGRGQSSAVYKSVLVNRLIVCAEKVVVVGNASKRVQLVRELESLKFSLQYKSSDGNESSNDIINHSSSNSTSNTLNSSFYCPYIVNLIDVIPNPRDGTLSVCLEYMDGGSLQDIIAMGGCSQERVLVGIANQMLTGLAFLHSKRIIHRDLKPSNTLFSSSGMVKLADFGLARALDEGNSMADSFIGTFDYMSPERLKGGNYSFVSDIWSFGLTIHAVAIGKYPYHAVRGYWSIMNAIQEQEPPLPSSDTFSQAFIDFIALTCTKDPLTRPTAASLLQHPFMTAYQQTTTSLPTHSSLPPLSPSGAMESFGTNPINMNSASTTQPTVAPIAVVVDSMATMGLMQANVHLDSSYTSASSRDDSRRSSINISAAVSVTVSQTGSPIPSNRLLVPSIVESKPVTLTESVYANSSYANSSYANSSYGNSFTSSTANSSRRSSNATDQTSPTRQRYRSPVANKISKSNRVAIANEVNSLPTVGSSNNSNNNNNNNNNNSNCGSGVASHVRVVKALSSNNTVNSSTRKSNSSSLSNIVGSQVDPKLSSVAGSSNTSISITSNTNNNINTCTNTGIEGMRSKWSPALFRRGKSGLGHIDSRKAILEESASFLRNSLSQKDFQRLKAMNIAANVASSGTSGSNMNTMTSIHGKDSSSNSNIAGLALGSNPNSQTNTPSHSRSSSRPKSKDGTKISRPGTLISSQSTSSTATSHNFTSPLQSSSAVATNSKPNSRANSKAMINTKSTSNSKISTSFSSPSLTSLQLNEKTSTSSSNSNSNSNNDMSIHIVPVDNIQDTLPEILQPTQAAQSPIYGSQRTSNISTNTSNSIASGAVTTGGNTRVGSLNTSIVHDPNMSGYNTPRNPVPNYHNHVGEFSTSRRQSSLFSLSPGNHSETGSPSAIGGGNNSNLIDSNRSPSSGEGGGNHSAFSEILKIVDTWKLYITKKLANPNRKARGLAEILGQASVERSKTMIASGTGINAVRVANSSSDEFLSPDTKSIQSWHIGMISDLGMEVVTENKIRELGTRLGLPYPEDLQIAFNEAITEIEQSVSTGKIIRMNSSTNLSNSSMNLSSSSAQRRLFPPGYRPPNRRSMSSNDSLEFGRSSVGTLPPISPTLIGSTASNSPFEVGRRLSQSAGPALSFLDSGFIQDPSEDITTTQSGLFIETDGNALDYSQDDYEDEVFELYPEPTTSSASRQHLTTDTARGEDSEERGERGERVGGLKLSSSSSSLSSSDSKKTSVTTIEEIGSANRGRQDSHGEKSSDGSRSRSRTKSKTEVKHNNTKSSNQKRYELSALGTKSSDNLSGKSTGTGTGTDSGIAEGRSRLLMSPDRPHLDTNIGSD